MSIHLMCLTSDGGVPIYSKKKGECENGVDLSITHLEEGMIIWKEYDGTLMMIGIARGITEKVLRNLLDYSYHAMVFCVGIAAIKKIKNIDRFKRELKNCYALIDQLLEVVESDFFRYNEAVLCLESLTMLGKLNDFSVQIGSPFCSILVRQKVACGTEGWWDLDIVDRKLLMVLLGASSTIQQDVPVFLPKKSPNIAYRFISIPITQGVSICALCGAEPPYDKLQTLSQQFWMSEIDLLITVEQNYPKNYPSSIELDPSIMGFLLLNKEHSKFVLTRNVQLTNTGKRTPSSNHRLDILRTFYHQSVEAMEDLFREGEKVMNLEQYWCSDYHKCHALIEGPNVLCVLYNSAIPTHIMRLVTQKTLNALVSDKEVCW
ncbi:protein fuzzy isoform X2 [Uranotaenia lowii]|uniref:protein fuzzy isoform X2 n=1 Tax=Uranotaenia lowii TaxID=190385 RepID=UPI00247AF55E|nr:protein fuzzy isoform X2 [Uranotaenia lowii]